MSSQAFNLDPSLANLPLDVLKKKYEDLTPEQRRLLGFNRPATQQEFDAAQQLQGGGAPADFAGRVLPNPDNVQISDDSDSGIPAMRLPNGVTAQTGAYNGTPQLDTSNPAPAQVIPPAMQTIGADFGASGEKLSKDNADATVVMYDPSGTPREIPFSHVNDARAAGAKMGVRMQAPDGKVRYVPADQMQAATAAGGKVLPIEEQSVQHPGFWASLGADLEGMAKAAPNAILNVAAPGLGAARKSQEEIVSAATTGKTTEQLRAEEQKKQGYSLPYRIVSPAGDFVGMNVRGTEQSAGEGDTAGVAGHTAAPLAVMAATEGAIKAAPAVADLAGVAADSAKPVLNRLAKVTRNVDPDLIGIASPRAAHTLKVAQRAAKVAEKYTAEAAAPKTALENAASSTENLEGVTSAQTESAGETPDERTSEETAAPKNAAANRVNAGASAREQARLRAIGRARVKAVEAEAAAEDFRDDGTSSQTESAGEIPAEKIPEEKAVSQNAVAARVEAPNTSPTTVEKQLNDALGGKPLDKNVSLKNQVPRKTSATSLPEGFTPTKSSLLKGYSYNPVTQELDGVLNTGERYRHSQVSPDQFTQFKKDAADSPGKAWNKLRQGAGVTAMGKVDAAGKLQPRIQPKMMRSVEVDPATGQPEFSDVLEAKRKNLQDFIAKPNETPAVKTPAKTKAASPKTEVPADDLEAKLQQSLDQVKAQKGGVATSADPGSLTKRWGVDENALVDTDANVRGLSEKESKAYLDKLTKSYKEGKPVQPVMETRDANNNIISVDGRHRALAAQRAGVKRIPVIVRRIGVVQ